MSHSFHATAFRFGSFGCAFALAVALSPAFGCSSSDGGNAGAGGGVDDGAADASPRAPREGGVGVDGGALADGASGDGAPNGSAKTEGAGTRLRPAYVRFDAADGASWRQWEGWYDTQRDEQCGVQRMSDGKYRCAPWGEEPSFVPDTYFSDAACKAPIMGTIKYPGQESQDRCTNLKIQGSKRYYRLTSRAACAPTRLVEVPTSAPLILSQYFYKMPDGSCLSQPIPAGVTTEIYAVQLPLTEVNPSSFVAFTKTDSTPATSSRLRVSTTVYTGDDGAWSRLSARLIDSGRNEICYRRTAADGVQRCMPYGGYVASGQFTDPGCTQPSWEVSNNGNCADDDGRDKFASYMDQTDYTACYATRVYERFTSGQLSTIYYGKPGTCSSQDVTRETGYTYYAAKSLPAPIPATDFVAISSDSRDAASPFYGQAGSRLGMRQTVTLGDSDMTMTSPWITAYDTQKKADCYTTMLPDGNFYCVPNARYFDYDAKRTNLFADAACTESVFGVTKLQNGCGGSGTIDTSALYAETPFTLGACEAYRYFHIPRTPYPATTVYTRSSSNTCAPYTGDLSAVAFYRRRDCTEVQPSELVGVSVHTEK